MLKVIEILEKIWQFFSENMSDDELYLSKSVDICEFAYREKQVQHNFGKNTKFTMP